MDLNDKNISASVFQEFVDNRFFDKRQIISDSEIIDLFDKNCI
jgi:hypothetical protein